MEPYERDQRKAITKIKSIMAKNRLKKLVINRNYLPEIITPNLLDISKDDGLPIIKDSLVSNLKLHDISSNIQGTEIEFLTNQIPFTISQLVDSNKSKAIKELVAKKIHKND